MALLDTVKQRLHIYYSETNKDAEVQSMINSAVAFFKNAGWIIDISAAEIDALAVEAIVLYCKMAQDTDPSNLTNHPVLIAMIGQGRAVVTSD